MPNKLASEAEVLSKIGASDFRSISKNQIISFVSALPEMDKETAIKCIEQFPEFRLQAKEILDQLSTICDKAIDENKDSRKDAAEGYRVILDSLNERLNSQNISESERSAIANDMLVVADRIAELDEKNKNLLGKVLNWAGTLGLSVLLGGLALLGVKITGNKS